jgi:hypothetical protein
MTKVLKEKYKTQEGADKRARFENGLAGFEHRQGYKAKHYRYRVIPDGELWRVERYVPQA